MDQQTFVERVDGGPFEENKAPHAAHFTFDERCLEQRATVRCATCPTRIVFRGVKSAGYVTCRRCSRLMIAVVS